jgi:hypothetical protein
MKLNLLHRPYDLPSMRVVTARGFLGGATEEEIRQIIECGALWAWDVSSVEPGANHRGSRPVWSILTASVRALDPSTRASGVTWPQPTPADYPSAVAALLPPHDKPWLTGPEVKRALCVGRTHLLEIIRAGHVRQYGLTHFRRGPNGFPLIDRNSLTSWLSRRVAGGQQLDS